MTSSVLASARIALALASFGVACTTAQADARSIQRLADRHYEVAIR